MVKNQTFRRGAAVTLVAAALGLIAAGPAAALSGTYSCTGTRTGAAVITTSAAGGNAILGAGIPTQNSSSDLVYTMRLGTNTYVGPSQKGGYMTQSGHATSGYGTCVL
jgi:hypothetical protein